MLRQRRSQDFEFISFGKIRILNTSIGFRVKLLDFAELVDRLVALSYAEGLMNGGIVNY